MLIKRKAMPDNKGGSAPDLIPSTIIITAMISNNTSKIFFRFIISIFKIYISGNLFFSNTNFMP